MNGVKTVQSNCYVICLKLPHKGSTSIWNEGPAKWLNCTSDQMTQKELSFAHNEQRETKREDILIVKFGTNKILNYQGLETWGGSHLASAN